MKPAFPARAMKPVYGVATRAVKRACVVVSAVAVAALLSSALLIAPTAGGAAAVRAVGPIGITVANVERAARFYTTVLGFEQIADAEVGVGAGRMRVVRLQLGDEQIALTQYVESRGRPVPSDSRSHDRWFQHIAIIVSDMDRAYARLHDAGVEHVSPAPQRLPDWNAQAAGIRAFYFKDADGHVLEILWFPPGKGDPKWRRRGDRLFLGIDHTAIVVAETTQSLRCYRDALGLRVAGESENYGPEQERLNNVPGAHLRITTLRAAAGPGIEFLEYLSPRDGRPLPSDTRAGDLWQWTTTLVAENPDVVVQTVRGSTCTVETAPVSAGVPSTVRLRDADGHALAVIPR